MINHQTKHCTQTIRAEDGTIFGHAHYNFYTGRGDKWQTATVTLANTMGVVIGHDEHYTNDYLANHPLQGDKAPAWFVSPSSEGIDALARRATPDNVTLEANPNAVAVALYTGGQNVLQQICLARNASGHFGLITADILPEDTDKAEAHAETETGYGLSAIKLAARNAVQRAVGQWLDIPQLEFGSKYMGWWYDADNARFVHIYTVGTTVESMLIRHHLAGFNRDTVSRENMRRFETILGTAITTQLRKNSLNHDEVFALRRNGSLTPQTAAVFTRKPEILPPPAGFTI